MSDDLVDPHINKLLIQVRFRILIIKIISSIFLFRFSIMPTVW